MDKFLKRPRSDDAAASGEKKQAVETSSSSSSSSAAPPACTPCDTLALPAAAAGEHPFDVLSARLDATAAATLQPLAAALGYPFNPAAKVHPSRVKIHKARTGSSSSSSSTPGPVLYLMSRDQRVCDNWALLHAQALAAAASPAAPLIVLACLQPTAPASGSETLRSYGFMLRGLALVEQDLAALGIPFRVLLGNDVGAQVAAYAAGVGAQQLVCDFSPLRAPRATVGALKAALPPACGLVEVDAHNIVPAWAASDKCEVGARTLRPKIHAAVYTFCELPEKEAGGFPPVRQQQAALCTHAQALDAGMAVYAAAAASSSSSSSSSSAAAAAAAAPALAPRHPATGLTHWSALLPHMAMDHSVPEVAFAAPGERAARDALQHFLQHRLKRYAELRNDPTKVAAVSNLSPYLRYGQLSAQRAVYETSRVSGLKLKGLFPPGSAEARQGGAANFCEELVVRRELSDNYCLHTASYDSLAGAAAWARESLNEHRGDVREHVYTLAQLERGASHEDLWNSMQMELVHRGKLAGWCRMYWAKKILEWSASPEEALAHALALNDKYSLDGRDPNGFVGCMWSIAGVHDMGWTERSIFGKVRFMNLKSTLKKFDTKAYIALYPVRPLPKCKPSKLLQ